MATWNAPLPPNDVEAGDPGHPEMHNQLVDAITEARGNVDTAETTAAWATVSGKPTTFPPTIGAAADQAVAGNDARLSAGAAGTATVRALGTGAARAAAGAHTHTGLMTGSAPTAADSAATDVTELVADYNALLAALRTRGVLSA